MRKYSVVFYSIFQKKKMVFGGPCRKKKLSLSDNNNLIQLISKWLLPFIKCLIFHFLFNTFSSSLETLSGAMVSVSNVQRFSFHFSCHNFNYFTNEMNFLTINKFSLKEWNEMKRREKKSLMWWQRLEEK